MRSSPTVARTAHSFRSPRLRRALRRIPSAEIDPEDPSAPLRIYLDTMYERATNDFYEGVTRPAPLFVRSRYLIVVATPDAADRGPGSPDWMRREISTILKPARTLAM